MKSGFGLLKKGLLKTDGLTIDDAGFIHFSTEVYPDERVTALSNMCDTFEACDRIAGSHSTTICLAPTYITANDFLDMAENDSVPKNEHISFQYGMSKELEGYRWDSPYKFENDGDTIEEFRSTFVIHTLRNEVQGTFVFALSLIKNKEEHFFKVELSLVYVRPQFRNSTYGLDLTIAVARLATEVYTNIISSYRGKIPIDVIIYGDFESKGGERLGNLVVDEFRDIFQMLIETQSRHKNKLGEIYVEMGY